MHPTKKIGLIAAVSSFLLPFVALAYDASNTGLSTSGGAAGFSTANDLPTIIGTVIKAALGLVGVIFLVLMVYAGVIWMIARGDEAKVAKAKDTIINSVIGLVIVVGAYAITNFIIASFSQPATSSSTSTAAPVQCAPGFHNPPGDNQSCIAD
jgi:uncharacterized membrane protein YjgN (DUF898 family)